MYTISHFFVHLISITNDSQNNPTQYILTQHFLYKWIFDVSSLKVVSSHPKDSKETSVG